MKSKNYLNINKIFWNREYYSPNVEGFVFRLKPKLLDHHIPSKKKLTVLDYGCGEGSNINYLTKNYKYDGYGVDISEPSIAICKKINKEKFKIIDSKVNENDNFFNIKFDLIISIQVLYYLNNKDLEKRLLSLNNMLKPGGYVFFTMMSTKSEYFKYSSNKKINSDGMTLVDLSKDSKYTERQPGAIYSHYINFCKNKSDLKNKFKIFKPLSIGYYDGNLESTSLSGHHFTFFGKKRDNK